MEVAYEPVSDFSTEKEIDTLQTWTIPETLSAVAVVVFTYLIITLKIIPAFMKNREPYKLKGLLMFYNAFQVLYSLYMVQMFLGYMFIHGTVTTRCPRGKDAEEVVWATIIYFTAKHLDLLDTVFFSLRKKYNQVSFLHLYHHSVMITWTWLHLMYHQTDHFVTVGFLNSFVHVLMYSYYLISSLGPEYAKYVWWKRHLTKVQLVQFILVITNLYYHQKLAPCPIPGFFYYFCMLNIGAFFVLFLNFYFRSYRGKKLN